MARPGARRGEGAVLVDTRTRVTGLRSAGLEYPIQAHQKNAASDRITTITAPTASLVMVPQNRPTAAPQPASTLENSGRPAHRSPISEPAKAPRQAPIRVPTSGTGMAVPMIPPTRLPTMANAAARVEPPAWRDPAAPKTNSNTSPSKANAATTPSVVQLTRTYAGSHHFSTAVTKTMSHVPGRLNRMPTQH